MEANGLRPGQVEIPDEALREIIQHYTREAGVRNLDAASVAPLTKATGEAAEGKGWTLFELPETVAAGVPDALIAMFGGMAR
jgi:ATP-dependent Lon protease